MSEEIATGIPDAEDVSQAVALLEPSAGLPPVIDTSSLFEKALKALAAGNGPFAIDAERASGYKYSARAYLIQIKRRDGGLHLIDPIAFGPESPLFSELNTLLQSDEVILHASTQDLPCLREIGIHPLRLFDTELGGRIAGLPRVGLGPLLESLLGVLLAKEHSAVDWSTRPLPKDWLNYAALDVEMLIELREKIFEILSTQKKLRWAQEEFDSILKAPPASPRVDPWRRTSGAHRIKGRDQLAIVRDLWVARNNLAQQLDISQGRLLSDAAIIALAIACPGRAKTAPVTSKKELEKILRPIGLRARWFEHTELWISTISQSLSLQESQWPPSRGATLGLPPIKLWRERFPEKYAPLTHARAGVELLAKDLNIPAENLISPEFVRQVCWNSPRGSVATYLATLGARQWQIDLIGPTLESALLEIEPLPIPEEAPVEAVTGEEAP